MCMSYMLLVKYMYVVCADVPGSGLYFGGYEFLLSCLTPEGKRWEFITFKVCVYL